MVRPMLFTTLRVLLWVSLGHAAIGGLFWWLLNVPESSVWMVGLSGLLVLLIAIVASITVAGGALRWIPGVSAREAIRRAVASAPALVLAAALFLGISLAATAAGGWFGRHAGEIDALFMSRFQWTRTAWVHEGIAIVLYMLRFVVGLTLALALLLFSARGGAAELRRTAWLRAALSRRLVGAVGIFQVLLILLPLQALYWRPRRLPPTAMEATFVAVKLTVIFLLVNAGVALILRAVVAAAPDRGAPPPVH